MTTWLVTGSAGFLGTNAGHFLDGRVRRLGLSRSLTSPRFYDEQLAVDLRHHRDVQRYIRTNRPDVILHAAALSGHVTCAGDHAQAIAVNVTATQAIADAAADAGSKLIYISTDAVFPGTRGDYAETDTPEPFSYYGETKLAGEDAVRETVSDFLVLRTNFFGWSVPGKRSVLEFFVDSLRTGSDVPSYPDTIVTSIYVQSMMEIIWRLVEGGATGTFHLASSDALSKHDFGVATAMEFGLNPELIAPEPLEARSRTTARSRDISMNTDLLASVLGERLPTQAEGIHRARLAEDTLRPIFIDPDGSAAP